MIKSVRKTCAVLLAFTLLGLTAGCGGNGSGGSSSGGSVSGLSTPASVSVVNAN